MTEKIYVLSYFGYEEYDPVFLQGPEVNDWELYVSQFEKEALQKANVSLQRKNKKNGVNRKLSWRHVIPFILKALKRNGYNPVYLPEKSYSVNFDINSKGEKINEN